MNNIRPIDDGEWDWDPEYYLLPSNTVARIVYDEEDEEYTVSEAMGPEGVWFPCDIEDVLTGGAPITEEEAMEMVDGFGGDW